MRLNECVAGRMQEDKDGRVCAVRAETRFSNPRQGRPGRPDGLTRHCRPDGHALQSHYTVAAHSRPSLVFSTYRPLGVSSSDSFQYISSHPAIMATIPNPDRPEFCLGCRKYYTISGFTSHLKQTKKPRCVAFRDSLPTTHPVDTRSERGVGVRVRGIDMGLILFIG